MCIRDSIDAVGVFVDETLQASHLTLDALEPRDHLLLLGRVPGCCMHTDNIPLRGMLSNLGRHARWVKSGFRFSRKAAMPSWASAVVAEVAISSAARAYAAGWSSPTWA